MRRAVGGAREEALEGVQLSRLGARRCRLDGLQTGWVRVVTAYGPELGLGARGAGRARLGGQLDVRLDEDLEELRGAQLLEERAHRLRRPVEEARLVEGLRADAQGGGHSHTARRPLIHTVPAASLIHGMAASVPVLEREAHWVQLAT